MQIQVTSRAYRGEQLVYIAALTAGAPLVFGDRPKDITYRCCDGYRLEVHCRSLCKPFSHALRRLYMLPSISQLDEGFGLQAIDNYRQMLGEPLSVNIDAPSATQLITMQVCLHCCTRSSLIPRQILADIRQVTNHAVGARGCDVCCSKRLGARHFCAEAGTSSTGGAATRRFT